MRAQWEHAASKSETYWPKSLNTSYIQKRIDAPIMIISNYIAW